MSVRGACLSHLLFVVLVIGGWDGCSRPVSSSTDPTSSISPPIQLEPLPRPYSLGILPFEDLANRPELAWLHDGIPDMLTTDLALLPGLQVVSRPFLGEILREQWLQLRGTSTPNPTIRMGKLVGARYLLKGSFYVAEDQLVLEAHLLDVEHGTVIRTTRRTGALHAIPALERQLAHQIGELFSLNLQSENSEKRSLDVDSQPEEEPEDTTNSLQSPAELPTTTNLFQPSQATSGLLVSDALLSLERLQREREDAWLLVDWIWSQGVSVKLGTPQYHTNRFDEALSTQPMVWVPVSAFLMPDRLRDVHRDLHFPDGSVEDSTAGHGILTWKGSDPGANALFRESLQTPRRLFVRAIDQSGEVTAVSSSWSWRVDRSVNIQEEGRVKVPIWPKPVVSGFAGFPRTILSDTRGELSFDTIIVPVSEERRVVSVDLVVEEGAGTDSTPNSEDKNLLATQLKTWLFQHWMPPLVESVPVSGYLPGNIRTAQMLVSGENGAIQGVELKELPAEEPLISNLKQLTAKMIGQCFRQCDDSSLTSESSKDTFTFRVQLDLIKDMRKVGLGGKRK